MANSDPLVLFGLAIMVIVGLFIAVPYLRGKSDLLTAWNTLLLGIVLFTGFGSLEVKYVPQLAWEHLHWFQPTAKEVQWYMLATSAFIVTLLAAYYFNSPAKAFAQKRLQKWPELNAPVAFFVAGCCFVAVVISILFRRVTFIGPVSANLAVAGVSAATVFTFALWYRDRRNVAWLALFIGVLLITAIYAMVVSPGRRLLMSVFLGPVIYLYWTSVRYWKPTRAIVAMGIAALVILSVSVVYAKVRWYNIAEREQRSTAGVLEQLRNVVKKGDIFSVYFKNQLSYFGQGNGQFALLTQRYVSQHALTPIPLNTLRFLITYPIPRNIWAGKPETVGVSITRDVARVTTNWGLGIAGQGVFEGGIPALMLYAVLLAFFVRILDEPLQLQPTNPFLIYMHASALPHVASIPRGDMGNMVKEAAQAVLFAYLLGLVCRFFFGTRKAAISSPASQSPLSYQLRRRYQ
jgi:hypothetical protein